MTDQTPSDILNIELAREGELRTEWAAREMPVLRSIRERFEREQPLKGMRIAGCLHITSETANLVETLVAGGAEVTMCASNPLSTQDDVAAYLVSKGVPTFAIKGEDSATYNSHITSALDTKPHMTMDDGADLVAELHTARTELLDGIIGGMEETTTGVIRLKALAGEGKLRFPVVAVNDSDTKHMFDNRYGTGQSTLDGIIRATNVLITGKTIVTVGYGWCGRGFADRAKGMGAHTVVCEVDPVRALEAVMDGHRVMPMSEAAKIGDIFLTVTGGKHAVGGAHFDAMKDGAIVCNIGHFDIEIQVEQLKKRRGIKHVEIKPQVDEYTFPDGHSIILLAEGRLVNLGCATGHSSFVMSMSFTNQVLAQIELYTKKHDVGVYVLPKRLDEKVARLHLKKLGIKLEKLSTEQADYLGISRGGPYKADHYRY